MEKSDPLAFGADSGRCVDEPNAGHATALERCVQIVNCEADVMQPRTVSFDKLGDGRVGCFGFEQFNERLASYERSDRGTIHVINGRFWEAEDVAIEWYDLRERAHGDADVGDMSGHEALVLSS